MPFEIVLMEQKSKVRLFIPNLKFSNIDFVPPKVH